MRTYFSCVTKTLGILAFIVIAAMNQAKAADNPDSKVETEHEPDLKMIDIAAVKLGMTVDQAIAALKEFDAEYTIRREYLDHPKGFFNAVGADENEIIPSQKGQVYLNDLHVIKGLPHEKCNLMHRQYGERDRLYCGEEHDTSDDLTIWLSPVDGDQRVIGISRINRFYTNAPTMKTLSDAITKKISRYVSFEYDDNKPTVQTYVLNWCFDRNGHYIPGQKAKAAAKFVQEFPALVSPADGSTYVFYIQSGHDDTGAWNPHIAEVMHMSFWDGAALYQSIEQSKKTFSALSTKSQDKEAAKAASSAVKPKF